MERKGQTIYHLRISTQVTVLDSFPSTVQMLRSICLKLLQEWKHRAPSLTRVQLLSASSVKGIAELHNSKDPQSLSLSFLQNSCGLSLESAISASKKLNVENIKNPNSVVDLFRAHGLTQTHIRSVISSRPPLLLADLENTLKPNMELFKSLGFSGTSLAKMLCRCPRVLEIDASSVVEILRAHGFKDEQISTFTMKRPDLYLLDVQKIFKPKLEFFKSLGLSTPEISKLLAAEPSILGRSLEKQIIPCIQELKRILGTDENVLRAIKGGYGIIQANVEKVLKPNLSMLISHGVPESLALKLFFLGPKALLMSRNRFEEIVSEVKKLGFDPNNFLFLVAIRSMAMSKTQWEKKLEAYRSFGLSKGEIYSAFKKQPMFMVVSEKKIKRCMTFFFNKLKMKPSLISSHPILLLHSLEKRLIPRCSVMQILTSNRLIKEDINILQVWTMSEKNFLEKFVSKYENEVPDVLRAVQGKIEFQGFPFELKLRES